MFENEFKYFIANNGGPNIVSLNPNFSNPTFMADIDAFEALVAQIESLQLEVETEREYFADLEL